MLDEAAKQLMTSGSIAVIPTDTVYGVVARVSDEAAVERLYTLKEREGKPGTLIAASIDQLEQLGIKRRYLTAVAQYWPGAVSVVLPCGPELAYLHQGKYSLAVRIPDVPELSELLQFRHKKLDPKTKNRHDVYLELNRAIESYLHYTDKDNGANHDH